MNRVILVDESIFTEDLKTLHETLNKSINVFRNLKDGIKEKELLDNIKSINDVADTLRDLSEKNFQAAKVSMAFFEMDLISK